MAVPPTAPDLVPAKLSGNIRWRLPSLKAFLFVVRLGLTAIIVVATLIACLGKLPDEGLLLLMVLWLVLAIVLRSWLISCTLIGAAIGDTIGIARTTGWVNARARSEYLGPIIFCTLIGITVGFLLDEGKRRCQRRERRP